MANVRRDARVSAAPAQFDPSQNGILVTFPIEEWLAYRFGDIYVRRAFRSHGRALAVLLNLPRRYTYNARRRSTRRSTT